MFFIRPNKMMIKSAWDFGAYMSESFQDFEADFPQKVSLKMLN